MQRAAPRSAWQEVLEWAAAKGLTSPSALTAWLGAMAKREDGAPADRLESALLRALSQNALLAPPGAAPAPASRLAALYRPLLATLDQADAAAQRGPEAARWFGLMHGMALRSRGSATLPQRAPSYPEGMRGVDLWAPVIDPQAAVEVADGLLWPPSPVTVIARAAQIFDAAAGRPPRDPVDLVVAQLRGEYGPDAAADVALRAAVAADSVGLYAPLIPVWLRGLRVSPEDQPRLAGPLATRQERRRIAGGAPFDPQAPYVVVVGTAPATWDLPGMPTGHVAALFVRNAVAATVEQDASGQVTASNTPMARWVERQDQNRGMEPVVAANRSERVDPATGIGALLLDAIDAVREGRPEAMGLEPFDVESEYTPWPDRVDVRPPVYAGAFDRADVAAAVRARMPGESAQRIAAVLAGDMSLAAQAARAYRGDVPTPLAPHEVNVVAAAYAAARECAADPATVDRQRLAAVATFLGVRAPGSDPRTLCAELAPAIEARYGL